MNIDVKDQNVVDELDLDVNTIPGIPDGEPILFGLSLSSIVKEIESYQDFKRNINAYWAKNRLLLKKAMLNLLLTENGIKNNLLSFHERIEKWDNITSSYYTNRTEYLKIYLNKLWYYWFIEKNIWLCKCCLSKN